MAFVSLELQVRVTGDESVRMSLCGGDVSTDEMDGTLRGEEEREREMCRVGQYQTCAYHSKHMCIYTFISYA